MMRDYCETQSKEECRCRKPADHHERVKNSYEWETRLTLLQRVPALAIKGWCTNIHVSALCIGNPMFRGTLFKKLTIKQPLASCGMMAKLDDTDRYYKCPDFKSDA